MNERHSDERAGHPMGLELREEGAEESVKAMFPRGMDVAEPASGRGAGS